MQTGVAFDGMPPGWDMLARNGLEFATHGSGRSEAERRARSGGSGGAGAASGAMGTGGSRSGGGSGGGGAPKNVAVVPSHVSFGERATCMCHLEEVTIANGGDKAIEISSVSIDNSVFTHSFTIASVGKAVSLAAGHNMTLRVVFLPGTAREDAVARMTIATSEGVIGVKVRGRGIPNEFGIESFQGIRVPPSVFFSPPIVLTNPHNSEVLRVLEVFTTGNFLQLALPEGKQGDAQHRPWDLLPLQSKTVMHLAFLSNTQGRFVGFVALRTSRGMLFLRVDLTVAMGGLYATTHKLEFHTLTNARQRKRLRLKVINSSPLPVALLSMRPEEPESLLKCDFKAGQTIAPGTEQSLGEVEFRGTKEGVFSGRIVVETSSPIDAVLFVPYTARVMHGSLKFSVANTTFFTPGSSLELQNIVRAVDGAGAAAGQGELQIVQSQELTNSFRVPITLYSASIDDPRFTIVKFEPGVTIPPNGTYTGLLVQYRGLPDASISRLRLSMQSNVAKEFAVPIWTFHGRLGAARVDSRSWAKFAAAYSDSSMRGIITKEVVVCEGSCLAPKYQAAHPTIHDLTNLYALLGAETKQQDAETAADDIVTLTERPNQVSVLDFGTLTVNELRGVRINITNMNPRDIKLHRFTSDIPSLKVKFEFIHYPASRQIILLDNPDQGLWIRQHHSAIFSLTISAATEQRTSGKLTLETWFETRDFLVTYETVVGALRVYPKSVDFGAGLPGMVRRLPLFALSTYRKAVSVLSIQSSDERFVGVVYNSTLESEVNTTFGVVLFDSGRLEQVSSNPNVATKKWSKDLQYIPSVAVRQLALFGVTKKDVDQHNQNEFLWGRLRATGQDVINATLTIVTNVVPNYDVAVTARVRQPSLGVVRDLEFPLTQYGEATDKYVTVSNPSDVPVLLECAAFYTVFDGGDEALSDDESSATFLAPEDCSFNLDDMLTLGGERKRLSERPISIPGGGQMRFGPISFKPRKHTGTHRAVLVLKNNLTLIQTVNLSGEGGTPVVRFLDSKNWPLPHSIALNATVEPSLYRAHTTNVGPPIRTVLGIVDSEGKGHPISFNLSGARVVAQCTSLHVKPMSVVSHVQMKNIGTLPLWIRATLVGSSQCSSRGFLVEPCLQNTWLLAAETFNISVTYTPDFSSSRVSLPLNFVTSIGVIALPLEAVVSAETLAVCHYAAPEVSAEVAFWFSLLRLLGVVVFGALAVFVGKELMRKAPPSSPGLSSTDAQLLEMLKVGSRDSAGAVAVVSPPHPVAAALTKIAEEQPVIAPIPIALIDPVPPPQQQPKPDSPGGTLAMSRSSSSELSPTLSRTSDPSVNSRTRKNRQGARKEAAHAAAVAASAASAVSNAPAIVKETVSIPPKLSRVNSAPSPTRGVALQRDSSDSRESEESSEEQEKSHFSVRFDGAMDSFDSGKFAFRIAELARIDVRRVKVVLIPSAGSFVAECAVSEAPGDKSSVRVRQLLKSSKSQLAGQSGHAVLDYAVGKAFALRPASPVKLGIDDAKRSAAKAKKDAKKVARKTVASHDSHSAASLSAPAVPVVRTAAPSIAPSVNATTAAPTATRAMRQPAVKTALSGKTISAPTVMPPAVSGPSPPPPPGPASVPTRPKRMFKAVDLFGESESSSSNNAASFGSVPFSTATFNDGFLSVPSFPVLDSPSPPPSVGQNLLPRDLLSSSGSGFSSEFGPTSVRLVKSEPPVPLQSLFGDWSVINDSNSSSSVTADSLISQLRAPPTLESSNDNNSDLFAGLSWIGQAGDSLFEVELEEDPSLVGTSTTGIEEELFHLFPRNISNEEFQ